MKNFLDHTDSLSGRESMIMEEVFKIQKSLELCGVAETLSAAAKVFFEQNYKVYETYLTGLESDKVRILAIKYIIRVKEIKK